MKLLTAFASRHITKIGVVGISTLMLLVTMMFVHQTGLTRATKQWVLHTYEVTEQTRILIGDIKDMHLSQLNFMISNDERHLEGYYALLNGGEVLDRLDRGMFPRRSIAEELDHLKELTKDNGVQQTHYQKLEIAIARLKGFIDEMIAWRRGNPAASVPVDKIQQGREMMIAVRKVISDILLEEQRLLAERNEADDISNAEKIKFVLVAVVGFYAAMLFLLYLVARHWKHARAMEQEVYTRAREVEIANDKLQSANMELAALNEAIKESGQTRLRAVVDNALDCLITINAQGAIESFNPACEGVFGYKAEEVVGSNIKILMPEPHQSAHDGYIAKYHETGKAAIIGTPGREVSAKRKDGSIFPIDLSISTFRVDGEQHFSGILRDITKRKAAENELLRYTAELERSNQELDDFAYIASHDLKEPLRGLFNHASFLLEDYMGKLDADGVRRLNRLALLSQRMEQLVNDLLYFSRLGRVELAVQRTDPNQVIREIIPLMESFLKEHNAKIIIPNPIPTLVCDKPRITEVFRNLITNAVKYNDKPERLVEIGFLEETNSPYGQQNNVFYVKDNGVGIPKEFHQEIFRIFKRLGPSTGGSEGTGVGLTFVKKIVERHKGHIWLESKPGEGTIFYFNFNQGVERYDQSSLQSVPKYSVG